MNETKYHEGLYKEFCTEMQAWLDAGTPEDGGFNKDVGLCMNLVKWCKRRDIKPSKMVAFQDHLFEEAELETVVPFSENNSLREYYKESNLGLVYKNEARLNWIRTHAA